MRLAPRGNRTPQYLPGGAQPLRSPAGRGASVPEERGKRASLPRLKNYPNSTRRKEGFRLRSTKTLTGPLPERKVELPPLKGKVAQSTLRTRP